MQQRRGFRRGRNYERENLLKEGRRLLSIVSLPHVFTSVSKKGEFKA